MDGHFSIILTRMDEQNARVFLPFNLLVAIVAVSTASTFIRFAQAEGMPSLVIAAVRLTIAALILSPVAWIRYHAELMNLTRRDLILSLASGLFLAIHFATWISSLEYTSVASSVVLVSTTPLWVAILSGLFLKEQLSRLAIAGLVLALVGGAIIGLAEACTVQNGIECSQLGQVLKGRALWGNFLALCGALAVSGYLFIGRTVRAKMSLVPYIFLVYGISAVVLIAFMLTAGKTPLGYSSTAYGWILLLAVVPQLIGHSMFNWLLKYLSATLVAVTTLAEPIGSAALAYVFLKESPSAPVLIGGTLILLGIFLTSRKNNDSLADQ
jgi:drug/metabolite transporter (DMT)-like permease